MTTGHFQRGAIYAATMPHIGTEKYFVVVSNNARNRRLETALVARITSSQKPPISSIVPIDGGEPVYGYVCCDDIELLYHEDCRQFVGAFSPPMMAKIGAGLRAALGL
ncbi:type II toxin-antitoxin system PemK/MazF family toxin [Mycobacteroides abscessus]|uniref:type II toxin-antitoxin system PemK/MazF family toxin n=1 Tax=Mycobacteroides abscessus TaxID=36809 RepID=UPI00092A1238|nr:type II toxin-antitoxin system PemK/MazF family toxin [Mycobacteroides abscessus]MBN7454233.1 type II toxin-antitoxin system PemK/MazF family toxin [Mycobacteroides abscessus subsp. abscessus]MBN7542424.1 type II toxin-antitoxin system PemK/MazF family toxin [Mycobacteroides abscessus subsp. abscessus]MBN7569893.1 type II toxin-antitoxin system PemK/MazF family toxin [Mycobacteroides abscessus subsp. abscessus]QSM93373.1 type II toxin-antitoxin system PemK/MazF family toxin [Mycobacteroides 